MNETADQDKLLSTEEVAESLGVVPRTVQRKIKSGELVGDRVGKRAYVVRQSDLAKYQEQPTRQEQETDEK